MPGAPASQGSSAVRSSRLSTGHVALFNTVTQELILIEPGNVGELTSAAVADAWDHANLMAGEKKGVKLSATDMQAVQLATTSVVLLSGSGGWPP